MMALERRLYMLNRIPRFELGRFDAVAIGSSTGGPGHVETILAGLPADMPCPIFIAQHLPATSSASLPIIRIKQSQMLRHSDPVQ